MTALKYMQAIVLLLGILVPALKTTGAQSIGVCYGRNGDNLPSQQATIDLCKANRIGKMRLYHPDQAALQALRGTDIEVILDVPNPDLQSLQDPAAAKTWVQNNIQSYTPGVNFRYIAVGNEVDPSTGNSQYVNYVLPAMRNVHDAIVAAGLQDQIKVSTATYSGITSGFPPSKGEFHDNAKGFIEPIIQFLAQNNLPLLANIYPYFSYLGTPQGNLDYALFRSQSPVVSDDGNRQYWHLFDALLDTIYSGVEKAGGPNVEIIVSESGWPSAGDREASVENARTYYQNLISHAKKNGTPKRPDKLVQVFLFAMYDENQKGGAETEKHFGIFDPTSQQSKYQLSF
ncbi:glucan endo-1,3-beta-glucosidase [Daucus carota subsp. sativus]|uniref:Glucan endo-1,3-beta-D-glucosidase n=1 Tax=Daucus carota subsp. sativus TaxID=79200 RepID=A0A165ZKY8_DAUCS|nr:PREDICTED: glucan endo-1,3-beta-glucosidase-like [Daucus carota subsp. sativus]